MCNSHSRPPQLDRRVFLKTSGLALFAMGAGSLGGPLFLQRAAAATPQPGPYHRRKVLVTIFQRGAMDGIAAVPPLSGNRLRTLRPRLAMGAARSAGDDRILELDADFGLHPALEPLGRFFGEGRLGIVHAVGSPDATRSHFDAQDYMESGTPGRKGTASGWLNRVAGELGHEASPFRSVAFGAALPKSLYGPEPALAVSDLGSFQVRPPGTGAVGHDLDQGFEALYQQTTQELLQETAGETFDAVELLDGAGIASYRPDRRARYPRGQLGSALRQIAFLIKSNLGLEVAFAESGGWDTHVQQGTTTGSFARRAQELAQAIEAFWTDLGPYQHDVVLMTMTEFGRTVAENGSGGTDHGHGSCLFVLGHDIDGGKVHGQWPGLDHGALFEGRDLAVTTDFRSVFAEVAHQHLGVASPQIFPGWSGPRLPLFRA